ncbi:MAG: hypothetical protein RJA57_1598 [Bacteroidota bacterium]|jgi:hypothetical protein
MPKTIKYIFSFVIATVIVCIANFVLQITLIFMDLVSRLDASSLMVIILWLVTGVFGAVFTQAVSEQVVGKDPHAFRNCSLAVLLVSLPAMLLAIGLLSQGLFKRDPQDFSLLFSNAYVFLAYFTGAAGMALVMRKLD